MKHFDAIIGTGLPGPSLVPRFAEVGEKRPAVMNPQE